MLNEDNEMQLEVKNNGLVLKMLKLKPDIVKKIKE